MIIEELDQGWSVRAVGGDVPDAIGSRPIAAAVPGTVHTDLLAAGLIPDPYLGTNEADLVWFHRSAWQYDRQLETTPPADDERLDLVFEGLDTVATVFLDGAELGRTANMHRSYRFDVRAALAGGPHRLSVRFDSALEHAEAVEKEVGARPRAYDHPFNAVRKMACSFGWDWGPDLQTAGIWKPASLQRWRVARFAAVRPLVTLDADGRTGRVAVHVDVERSGLGEAGELTVRVALADLPGRPDGLIAEGRVPAGSTGTVVELDVPDAPVWWPVGHGDHPLVGLTVELAESAGDGAVLDSYTRRVGFRSVRVDQTPDEHGTPFTLVVNDRPVFVLGLNWIPEDHLLTRITRDDLVAAVDRAVAGNANLLRIWGGGVFESEDFYDVCDERGVMVWQDFLLACAAYAEEEPVRSEVLAEVRENVTRLVPHASLVIWNGGNENIWGHEDWGWKEGLGGATWGAGYYYEDFPALLAELDPTRPYNPGSPSSPGFAPEQVHPNDPDHGTRHEWDVWNRVGYRVHADHVPRFNSEFGWQAPPAWATLTRAIEEADLAKESPAFLLHQKAEDGNGKLDRGLAPHFAVPEDFRDWHWATQLNQARATSFAVEHLRSWAPRTMGSIIWQLNDCWPVTSWAVVDGDGRLKPAWYAMRRAQAPRLATFQQRDGELVLVLVNDADQPWTGAAQVRRAQLDGTVLASAELGVQVAPRGVQVLGLPADLLAAGEPDREVLVVDAGPQRAVHLFVEDRDLAYVDRPVTAEVTPVAGGYQVEVTATSFARDVTLLADQAAPDAVVDDQLVTLLAGECHTFTVRTSAEVDSSELTRPDTLRSANALTVAAPVS